ncbi:hypothetical protein D3C71_2229830 [compost metagenome]
MKGTGKFYQADGGIYEGELKEGKPEGQGKLFDGDGKLEYSGLFKNGYRANWDD